MKSFAAFLMLFFISVTLFTFCKKDKEFKSSEIPVLTKSNYYKIGEKYTTTVSYDQSLMSFSVGASGSNIT